MRRNVAAARAMSEQQFMMAGGRHSTMGLVYPNIQVNNLDVAPALRGISLEAKSGDLFAIMATSQKEGTLLTATLAGLKNRTNGEILVNGQNITRHGLRNLCSYVPAPESSSLDPRMSVKSTLSFHATLCGPMDRSDLKERVSLLCCHNCTEIFITIQNVFFFYLSIDKYIDRRLRINCRSNIKRIKINPFRKAKIKCSLPIINTSINTYSRSGHNKYGHF